MVRKSGWPASNYDGLDKADAQLSEVCPPFPVRLPASRRIDAGDCEKRRASIDLHLSSLTPGRSGCRLEQTRGVAIASPSNF